MADGHTRTGPRSIDMSTGRLICEGPGSPGDDTGPDPVVTCWAGMTDSLNFNQVKMSNINNTYLTSPDPYFFDPADIGTNDFAFEYWIKRLYPDSITNWVTQGSSASGYCFTGAADFGEGSTDYPNITTAETDFGAGLIIRGQNFEAHWQNTNVNAQITLTVPMGWHHVAINFDRDGNMEAFVDGESQGTSSISGDSAQNESSASFYLQFMDLSGAQAQSAKEEVPYLVAGVAFHIGAILTDAEIADSVNRVGLQKLSTTITECFANQMTLQNGAVVNTDLTQAEDSDASTVAAEIPYPTYCLTGGPSSIGSGNQWATVGVAPQTNFMAFRHNIYRDANESTNATSYPILVDDPTWPPPQGANPESYA